MTHIIDATLAEIGLTLPAAPAPAANYVPYVQAGDMLYISGQISQTSEGLITGKVGQDLDTSAGKAAALTCALSILAQLRAAVGGDWDQLKRAVKLTGFVNSTPDFTEQPEVINGASDTLVAILGEKGKHARSAVSAAALPRGVAVEIEAIFQLR